MPTSIVKIEVATPADYADEAKVRLDAKKVGTPAATDAHGTRIRDVASLPNGTSVFWVEVRS